MSPGTVGSTDIRRLAAVEPFGSYAATATGILQLLWELSTLDVLLVTQTEVETDMLHAIAALVDGYPTAFPSVPWSGSACLHMVNGSAPEVAPRLAAIPAYANAANLRGSGMACYLGVPVTRGDGLLYGTVCGFGRLSRQEDMQELLPPFRLAARLLGAVLAAADAAEDRLCAAQSEHAHTLSAALTDPVTGVVNRAEVERLIAHEENRRDRFGHTVTVVMCDIDGLKAVNDSRGHAAGDALLRQVADALGSVSRASDVLGRVGGDEFLLMLPGEHHDGAMVARVASALDDLPVSFGAADTRENADLDAVRDSADRRMYERKRASRR